MNKIINFLAKCIAFIIAILTAPIFGVISILLWDIKFMCTWSQIMEDVHISEI